MHLPKKILLLTVTASVTIVACLQAQDAATDDIDRLERYVVTGVPVEQSVNPLTRDVSTVFGDARSILDTPRAVSSITEALLNERGIHGVKEFVVYSPGAYAPSSYGLATTPNLRGDVAETYLNGQRRSDRLTW